VRREVWWSLLWRLLGFALLWWVLTGDRYDSWLVGGFVVATAALVSLALRPRQGWRISLRGAVRFVPFFCLQSVRGGIDVTRRAMTPALPLAPVLVEHSLALPPGTARIFMLNTVSLLPGTLSADLREDSLVVHGLDGGLPLARDLRRLERHVADLFDLPLGGVDG
jgi:multicomponent Na+:H+ antiporter subunit E